MSAAEFVSHCSWFARGTRHSCGPIGTSGPSTMCCTFRPRSPIGGRADSAEIGGGSPLSREHRSRRVRSVFASTVFVRAAYRAHSNAAPSGCSNPRCAAIRTTRLPGLDSPRATRCRPSLAMCGREIHSRSPGKPANARWQSIPGSPRRSSLAEWTKFWFDWQWDAAEKDFRAAAENNPSNPAARMFLAHLQSNLARHDSAISGIRAGSAWIRSHRS